MGVDRHRDTEAVGERDGNSREGARGCSRDWGKQVGRSQARSQRTGPLEVQLGPVTRQPDLWSQDHFKRSLVEDLFADLHLGWPIHTRQDRGITWGDSRGGFSHTFPASRSQCAACNSKGRDGWGCPCRPHHLLAAILQGPTAFLSASASSFIKQDNSSISLIVFFRGVNHSSKLGVQLRGRALTCLARARL